GVGGEGLFGVESLVALGAGERAGLGGLLGDLLLARGRAGLGERFFGPGRPAAGGFGKAFGGVSGHWTASLAEDLGERAAEVRDDGGEVERFGLADDVQVHAGAIE